MRNKTSIEEIIEIFLSSIMYEIRENKEVPRFNIIFDEDGFKLFYDIKKKKHSNDITDEDIELLRKNNHIDERFPTIIVKDSYLFFDYLRLIADETFAFFEQNKNSYYMPSLIQSILLYIWLRMSPTDFDNVEMFLKRQLLFIKDRTFFKDFSEEKIVSEYCDYPIKAKVNINALCFETTRHMSFEIIDNMGNVHTLPMIHYDIMEENGQKICYIYAIQNPEQCSINTKIKRSLYKLNKGILDSESSEYLEYKNGTSSYYPENISDVPPSAVLALLTFFDILEKNDINKIRVPLLQVMNYDYHVLLSQKQKEIFPQKWPQDKIKNIKLFQQLPESQLLLMEYNQDKQWYEHVVDKEDFISRAKTENFIRLFRRICFHKPNIEIKTGVFEEADYLDIVIKHDKIKSKKY